jgi:co-chaperonin GroES (HSP10)
MLMARVRISVGKGRHKKKAYQKPILVNYGDLVRITSGTGKGSNITDTPVGNTKKLAG